TDPTSATAPTLFGSSRLASDGLRHLLGTGNDIPRQNISAKRSANDARTISAMFAKAPLNSQSTNPRTIQVIAVKAIPVRSKGSGSIGAGVEVWLLPAF